MWDSDSEFTAHYERGLGKIVQKLSKSQPERFKETARSLGADESNDALDRIMGKLDLKKKPPEPAEKSK